ncbi:hypothetical protein [Neobacillus thermocopriae]|uniref:hypothetical protein n=1 Tax=Neobacillus thermocopriae TaxID=1215031 RepID=UPI002E216B64|nr:hypothetical protein [Neobacillus thermocopriae]MED3713156.1 hypothetical protein [Neobacillus thermocopriae]
MSKERRGFNDFQDNVLGMSDERRKRVVIDADRVIIRADKVIIENEDRRDHDRDHDRRDHHRRGFSWI